MEFSKIITCFDGVVGEVHFNSEHVYHSVNLAVGAIIERFNAMPDKDFIEGLKYGVEILISRSEMVHFGELENDMIESVVAADELDQIKFKHNGNDWCFNLINQDISQNKFYFESVSQNDVSR